MGHDNSHSCTRIAVLVTSHETFNEEVVPVTSGLRGPNIGPIVSRAAMRLPREPTVTWRFVTQEGYVCVFAGCLAADSKTLTAINTCLTKSEDRGRLLFSRI